jgi:hypothetical protein
MTRPPSTLLQMIIFSVVIGLALSCFLLFSCLSDVEIACTLQMPAYWIAGAFGFGVHGGLYLFRYSDERPVLGGAVFLWLVSRPANYEEEESHLNDNKLGRGGRVAASRRTPWGETKAKNNICFLFAMVLLCSSQLSTGALCGVFRAVF